MQPMMNTYLCMLKYAECNTIRVKSENKEQMYCKFDTIRIVDHHNVYSLQLKQWFPLSKWLI